MSRKKLTDSSIEITFAILMTEWMDLKQSSEIGNIEERTMTCMRNRALCVAMFESLPTNSRDYTSLLSSSIDI